MFTKIDHMNDLRFFEDILEANVRNILLLLPMEFTAKQFIGATKDLLPNEYANILSGRSYKSLNVWISRWYLQGLSERGQIVKLNRTQPILTTNGNKSQNRVWRKQ